MEADRLTDTTNDGKGVHVLELELKLGPKTLSPVMEIGFSK